MFKKNDLVIIEAKFIRESKNSIYLDCEGDPLWFPKANVNFNKEEEELELPRWLAQKLFPNENF